MSDMGDDFLEDQDAVERLLGDDALGDEMRPLASAVRDLRTQAMSAPLEPDHRLADMFDRQGPGSVPPAPRGRWLHRPVVAFAAAFVAVVVFGAAALALVNRGSSDPVAVADTSSTSTMSAPAAAAIDGSAPGDEAAGTEDFLACAFAEVTGFLQRSAGADELLDRPRIISECGVPAIPSLGPEAEEYRLALNEWLACASEHFDAFLQALPGEPGAFERIFTECDSPPNPADYGIEFGFEGLIDRFGEGLPFDLEDLPFDRLGDVPLETLIDELLEGLPEDFRARIPGDFDLNGLLDQLNEGLPFDLEGFDVDRLGEVPLATLFSEFLEAFPDGFSDRIPSDLDLGGLLDQLNESLDFEGLDLESLDLDTLDLEGLGLEGLLGPFGLLDDPDIVDSFDAFRDELLEGAGSDGLHELHIGDLELLSAELRAEICNALLEIGLVTACD